MGFEPTTCGLRNRCSTPELGWRTPGKGPLTYHCWGGRQLWAVVWSKGVSLAMRPRAPFLGWPLQWMVSGGFVWFVPDPPTLVTQTTRPHVAVADVEILHDVTDEIVALGLPRKGLVIVNDWRTVRSVDAAVPSAWLRRADRPGNPLGVVSANHVAIQANPVLRAMVQGVARALQVALGHGPTTFVD